MVGPAGNEFEPTEQWADLPVGESFVDVCAIRVDERDHVWVLSRGREPIMEFDRHGERLAAWGSEHVTGRPHGMQLADDGTIWCTDDEGHRILQFDREGSLLETIATSNSPTETGFTPTDSYWSSLATIRRAAGPFNRPTGVAPAPDGRIYVADGYGNARIHVFERDGTFIDGWGEPGAEVGAFRVPHAITWHDDRLWVADRENSRVQAFSSDGTPVGEWIDLIRPTDVWFDDGLAYVSELACRVSILDGAGTVLGRLGFDEDGTTPFVAPHTVAVDSHGDLYVGEVSVTYAGVDRGANTVHKFRQTER